VLDNPAISDVADAATSLTKTVVTAHDGSELSITVERIADERDFQAIIECLKTALEASTDVAASAPSMSRPGGNSGRSSASERVSSTTSTMRCSLLMARHH
jgi:hypothetical protein